MSIDKDDWKVICGLLDMAAETAYENEKVNLSLGSKDKAHDAAFLKNRYRRIRELAGREMGRATS